MAGVAGKVGDNGDLEAKGLPVVPEVPVDPNAAARREVDPLAPQSAPPAAPAAAKKTAEKPKETVDKVQAQIDALPDGAMKEACKNMYQQMKEDPGSGGPLMAGVLKLTMMCAKAGVMLDSLPYSYHRRLDKMEDKKFEEKDIPEIMSTSRDESRETPTDDQKKAFGPSQDRASAKYVCNAMWGKDFDIESTDELAAKLLKTKNKEGGKPLYMPAQKVELKRMGMPYGTVLIFKPEFKDPMRFAAVATGHGDEFKYYDAKTNSVQVLSLKDTKLNCIQAFVPQFNTDIDYFGTPAAEGKEKFKVASEVDDTVAGRAIALKKKIETEAEVAKEFIESLKTNPDASSFTTEYLFDKIKENEEMFERVIGSVKQIKSKDALTGLLLALEQQLEIIDSALKYNEAAKPATTDEAKLKDIDMRIEYLKSNAPNKAMAYRDALQNALESLGEK